MKVSKVEEYFVYFPLLKPHSWGKDPLFSRRRFIQSFLAKQKDGDTLMDEFHARRLVDLYADTILRISYSYLKQTCDAEDICQTVFLKYLTNDCTFDSIDHEKAWIIRTTINACKDYLKSACFRRTVALDEAAAVAAPPVPDTEVLDALKRLPEQYRISLYLFYYEEYSAKEIAQVMGKSEANITQYLSRGRRKLRTLLTEERS